MALELIRRFQNMLKNIFHNAYKKSVIDPVNNRVNYQVQKAQNTAHFRQFIVTKCLKK